MLISKKLEYFIKQITISFSYKIKIFNFYLFKKLLSLYTYTLKKKDI